MDNLTRIAELAKQAGIDNEQAQQPALRIDEIRLSRAVAFRGIEISSTADVVNLQEIVSNTLKLTRRRRISRDGTRYPEPLPTGSPARKLSIEIRDYLSYRDTRGLSDNTQSASRRTLDMLFAVCGISMYPQSPTRTSTSCGISYAGHPMRGRAPRSSPCARSMT